MSASNFTRLYVPLYTVTVAAKVARFTNYEAKLTPTRAKMVAMVLLGGAGTRLWPLSSEQRPKQFLRLFQQRSLFQLTMLRLAAAGISDSVLVTNRALIEPVEADLAELGGMAPDLLLEPARRDSAPAIAAGVAHIRARHGGDTLIAVLPSDHLIPDQDAFAAALAQAGQVAADGWLMTFGIRPLFAATAFGYIERGAPIANHAESFAVAKFHEKPAPDAAERYVAAGTFDWNSGMFVFRADDFAREAELHMKDIWDAAGRAVVEGETDGRRLTLATEAFGSARKTSIDFALMEKSRRVATLPAQFRWSDVGNWSAVYDALKKDSKQNVLIGDVKVDDCSGSLIVGDGVTAAAFGLRDAVLVCTQAGTFHSPRERAADIKQLFDAG